MEANNKLNLDHIVIGATDLEYAQKYFQQKFGVQLEQGGQHQGKGTHNLLLKLKTDIQGYEGNSWNECYLEVIAKDKSQNIEPKWLGVGQIKEENPIQALSYAMRYDMQNIENGKVLHERLEGVEDSSRLKQDGSILKWRICRLNQNDRSNFPFLLDWKDSAHPSGGLKSQLILKGITIQGKSEQELENLRNEYQKINIPLSIVKFQVNEDPQSFNLVQFTLFSEFNEQTITL